MTKTQISVRVSPDTLAAIDAAAKRQGVSRGHIVDRWLGQQAASKPELTLGFWRLANGEVDGATCADCEQPIHDDPWMGVTTTYRIVGPLCASCARTD